MSVIWLIKYKPSLRERYALVKANCTYQIAIIIIMSDFAHKSDTYSGI